MYWIHNIDPVLIHLWGNFGIRYYGLAYVLAFVIAMLLMPHLFKKGKWPLLPEQQSTLLTAMILGVLVGGRVGYVYLYDLSGFLQNPLMLFKIWEGGMSSHGGFLGVIVASWWATHHFKYPFLKLGDILVVLTPPGLLLGRIANFLNGELWGKVSSLPWAVIFPQSMPPGTPLTLIPPRHPSQLYEAALEGLLLLLYTQWRFWKTKVLDYPGRLAGEFLFGYAVVRIFVEQFREPDAPLILGLSRGVFYSLFLAALGAYLIGRSYLSALRIKKSA